jgi:hypothetical protein
MGMNARGWPELVDELALDGEKPTPVPFIRM